MKGRSVASLSALVSSSLEKQTIGVYNRNAMSAADIPRDEVASAMAVRQELGKEYEPEVIEAFAERLEKIIDARIESRLGQQQPLVVRGRQPDPTVWIALGSIALGFPITGVAMRGGGAGGVIATIAAWGGIVTINILHARRQNRPSK